MTASNAPSKAKKDSPIETRIGVCVQRHRSTAGNLVCAALLCDVAAIGPTHLVSFMTLHRRIQLRQANEELQNFHNRPRFLSLQHVVSILLRDGRIFQKSSSEYSLNRLWTVLQLISNIYGGLSKERLRESNPCRKNSKSSEYWNRRITMLSNILHRILSKGCPNLAVAQDISSCRRVCEEKAAT
jgi:hypothetical protein